MNSRVLLSVLLLLSITSASFGMGKLFKSEERKDSRTCFEKCKDCTKASLLCPGSVCMNTSIKDILSKSLSDIPCLSPCFKEGGKCYHEWNYLPVTILLAAGAVYGLTRKPVLDKASSLIKCIKKKLKFGSKKHNEAVIYRKVAQWKEEIA